MSHILEHTRSPTNTLQAVYHLLKPGGIVAVYVPNGDGLQARHDFSTWEWYDFPSHLYYYSPHTSSLLFKKIGFKIEKLWSIASHTGTDVEFIKDRLHLDSIRQATRTVKALGPMCLGSELRILARKVNDVSIEKQDTVRNDSRIRSFEAALRDKKSISNKRLLAIKNIIREKANSQECQISQLKSIIK